MRPSTDLICWMRPSGRRPDLVAACRARSPKLRRSRWRGRHLGHDGAAHTRSEGQPDGGTGVHRARSRCPVRVTWKGVDHSRDPCDLPALSVTVVTRGFAAATTGGTCPKAGRPSVHRGLDAPGCRRDRASNASVDRPHGQHARRRDRSLGGLAGSQMSWASALITVLPAPSGATVTRSADSLSTPGTEGAAKSVVQAAVRPDGGAADASAVSPCGGWAFTHDRTDPGVPVRVHQPVATTRFWSAAVCAAWPRSGRSGRHAVRLHGSRRCPEGGQERAASAVARCRAGAGLV